MDDKYQELYEKLSRLQWLLHRQHMAEHAQRGPLADPTRGQGRVLAMLKLQPEISTKDLSYLLGIRQQSLNELINKLEKAGYVSRTPAEADKRIMLVKLTEKGEAAQQEKADYTEIFSCLSEEEQSLFDDFLTRIIQALENQLGLEGEATDDWMAGMQERFGQDQFARMMAMGGHMAREWQDGFGGPGGRKGAPHRRRAGWEGRDPASHGAVRGHGPMGRNMPGREGRQPDGRNPMGQDMPGSERFDASYDGPRPDRADSPLDGEFVDFDHDVDEKGER
ncbi:MarR family transcriptional regulator [Eubacteriales bacterium OttesenSCG-928-M02]|nr:MarR family transcriptional regulator [Eubacteriales bacterium OttesenSCG-928-M02]